MYRSGLFCSCQSGASACQGAGGGQNLACDVQLVQHGETHTYFILARGKSRAIDSTFFSCSSANSRGLEIYKQRQKQAGKKSVWLKMGHYMFPVAGNDKAWHSKCLNPAEKRESGGIFFVCSWCFSKSSRCLQAFFARKYFHFVLSRQSPYGNSAEPAIPFFLSWKEREIVKLAFFFHFLCFISCQISQKFFCLQLNQFVAISVLVSGILPCNYNPVMLLM